MSDVLLVIECGVAATRAARIENGRAARLWFGPARGDEREDDAPTAGRRFAGRVRSVNRALNAAFVDIGADVEAFLPLGKTHGPPIVEGALISVKIKAAPRQDKGALVKYLDAAPPLDRPGRLPPFLDAALDAAAALGEGAARIIVDDGGASAALRAAVSMPVEHETRSVALFERYGAERALEEAFERVAPLRGGGRLVIDEAQALTAIDVDTGGLEASSPARLREKIAFAAADEAVFQIVLRNIGGHVAVDFPSIGDKAGKARFRNHLAAAVGRIEGAGAFGFSKSGLFCFTAPHKEDSLLERFTQTGPAGPAPGRRFTTDWLARTALRTLEHRLRAAPQSRLKLRLGAEIYARIAARPAWTARLRERCGPHFELAEDKKLEECGFDLVEN